MAKDSKNNEHIFLLSMMIDGGGDEDSYREFICLAENPEGAFLMGLIDSKESDWVNLENRPEIACGEINGATITYWSYQENAWARVGVDIALANEAPKANLQAIQEWVDDIYAGAGWATDGYILNFCDNLTDVEKFILMSQLASLEMLYDEGEIGDYYESGAPEEGLMYHEDFIKQYSYLKNQDHGKREN